MNTPTVGQMKGLVDTAHEDKIGPIDQAAANLSGFFYP